MTSLKQLREGVLPVDNRTGSDNVRIVTHPDYRAMKTLQRDDGSFVMRHHFGGMSNRGFGIHTAGRDSKHIISFDTEHDAKRYAKNNKFNISEDIDNTIIHKRLRESTFPITTDKPLNPTPLKSAEKEYKEKATIHKPQPVKRFSAVKESILNARRRGKTKEYLKSSLPKQKENEPEEPTDHEKKNMTPVE